MLLSMLPTLPSNLLNPGNGGQGNRPSEETVNLLNPGNGGPGNRPSEEAVLTDMSPPGPGNDNQAHIQDERRDSGSNDHPPESPRSGAVVEPSKEESDAIQSDLKRFLAAYKGFLNGHTDEATGSLSISMRALHVSLLLNNALFWHLNDTDHRSELWKGVFQKLGCALKPKKDVEAEIVRYGMPAADTSRRKKHLCLIIVQIMMRMVLWVEGSCTDKFIFALMDAVMGPPADLPSAEPRRRMINELHSLAQLAAKYDIVPQDDFTEWLKNVLTIDTANPYEHDDAKFVSDVLEYQLDDEVVPGTPLQRNARSEVNQHPPESYRTPPGKHWRHSWEGNASVDVDRCGRFNFDSDVLDVPEPRTPLGMNGMHGKRSSSSNKEVTPPEGREGADGAASGKDVTTKQSTPPANSSQNNSSNSAKRVSPTNANDDYDVGHPLPKKRSNNNSSNSAKNRGATTKQATPTNNGEGNGSKSAKRVTPNNTNNGYDVGDPSPKKKSKNNNSCAGGSSGSESKDSKTMDKRGVKRQAYSKEAPGKSPVVHLLENHEDEDPCGKPCGSGKQNNHNKNWSKERKRDTYTASKKKKKKKKKEQIQNNRHKNRTQERERDAYTKVEKNQKTTNQKGTGSRKVLNNTPKLYQGEPNDRTCQAVSICALLEEHRGRIVYSDLIEEMPPEGDTTVASANIALARHGLKLRSVYGLFRKKDGVPFNLMKVRQCRLVLHLKLVTLKGKPVFHSIAWDGQMVWDDKECVKVNATTDRRTAHAAIAVFNHLYHHKRFKSWHIDNVFELVDKETPPFRTSAGSEQSILKHSNP